MVKNWGGEFWDEKIRAQSAVGVIIGTGASQADMDRNTQKILDIMNRSLLKHLPEGGSILDLGTGPAARFAIILSKRGYKVTGLDGASTTLELARKAAEKEAQSIEFVKGDFSDFTMDSTFDALFSVESFYHLPAHLHLLSFQCMHKALKPKGYALIQFSILNEYTIRFLAWNLLYRFVFVTLGPILKWFGRKSFVVTVARTSEHEAEDIIKRTGFEKVWNEGDFYLIRKVG